MAVDCLQPCQTDHHLMRLGMWFATGFHKRMSTHLARMELQESFVSMFAKAQSQRLCLLCWHR